MRNHDFLLKTLICYSLVIFPLLLVAQNGNEPENQKVTGIRTFLNPILGGDFPDPTIMRDGNDYYMTHSSMYYLPGLLVFHSTDLVNWEPISNALHTYIASVWAPDMCKHKDKYYLLFVSCPKWYRRSSNMPYDYCCTFKVN